MEISISTLIYILQLSSLTKNQHHSPEPVTLTRRGWDDSHAHADFKKPKLYATRSNKVEGEPKSPNLTVNPDSQLKFDESQIDSQVRSFSSCAMVGMWMGILCSVKILLL
jgi:hypothetical protein